MSYRVVLSPVAQKALERLPPEIQNRLISRISALAENPRPPGAKALQGAEGDLRIRVGDYRIVYRVEDDRFLVRIVKVGHRREIYRRR